MGVRVELLKGTWAVNAPSNNSLFGSDFLAGLIQTHSKGGQGCYGAALGLFFPGLYGTVFYLSVSALGVRQGIRTGLLAIDMATTACVPGWFTGSMHTKYQQDC